MNRRFTSKGIVRDSAFYAMIPCYLSEGRIILRPFDLLRRFRG